MPQICFYLHLHQPYRLKPLSIFEVGKQKIDYFSAKKSDDNQEVFCKVAEKSYLPMLSLLLRLSKRHPQFKVAFSISGIFIEQAEKYSPQVMKLLRKLAAQTDQVELLAETYYHSLSSLFSPAEFRDQVQLHRRVIWEKFERQPVFFRNTELIYSNDIAEQVAQMGYVGMLTEAVPRYLHGRKKTQVFASAAQKRLPLLLKHAELSDDIAFRFSDTNWQWYPLTVERYQEWIANYGAEELVNLFMDFETFGEHQWADTGIFDFFERWVQQFLSREENSFVLPTEAVMPYLEKTAQRENALTKIRAFFAGLGKPDAMKVHLNQKKLAALPVYDVPEPISWADVDRDLTAWTENDLQQDTIEKIYRLEEIIRGLGNQTLLDRWRRLQTSDHFYYMCTKWSADGDVHAYFSPYASPYEAYRNFSIALADLQETLI